MVHVGCALERMVINDGLEYKGERDKINKEKVKVITEANKIFKKAINITLSEDEILFLAEIME